MTVVRPGALVGAAVRRVVDPALLAGRGRYLDDLHLSGMVEAAVLRSPLAHALIAGVDTSAAMSVPGVFLVLHALDAPALAPIPCVWTFGGQRQREYPVLDREVRYVGQPVGIVVAETRAGAEDAAELVAVDYDELPVIADAERALGPGAPLLHPQWGTNVGVELELGDSAAEVAQVIADAAHVVARRLRIQRIAASPIETRGVVASWDEATGRLTVWTSTQAVHHVREHLAVVLGLRHDQIRVIAPHVGGAFGCKEHLYPDEVLVCVAAMRLNRPVKWVEDRAEHFTATLHGRDEIHDARLALDADGRFLAIWTDVLHDLGAHPSNVGAGPAYVASAMLPGPYRFGKAGARVRSVLSNRTPTGAYRGFGMQEATWVRERLVDEAARELGIDPVDLRLRNMLGPDELPHETAFRQEYDSGDYPQALRLAVETARQQLPAASSGLRRGLGLASYVEFTGLGPSPIQQALGFALNGYETSVIRLEADCTVTVLTGVCSQGQGHETSLAQLAADALSVPLERVRVVAGDTDLVPYSSAATIASRSMTVGGGALVRSANALREKVIRLAAHRFEASPADCELVDAMVQVKGDPATALSLADIATHAWRGWDLPAGESAGLEERASYDPPNISYSYATHVAAVAVDEQTGLVGLEGLWVVHDCGTVVNPMIVDGQVHGGAAQGIGMALHEAFAYDEMGQPCAVTFMDYLLPVAGDVPDIDVVHLEYPSPFTPGGMKGLGEGGVIGAAAAVGNAVAAALPEIAGRLTASPITPTMIWQLLHEHADGEAHEHG